MLTSYDDYCDSLADGPEREPSDEEIAAQVAESRCDGCDNTDRETRSYVVTHHDDTTSEAHYCQDCAALARVDYNGETKSIAEAA